MVPEGENECLAAAAAAAAERKAERRSEQIKKRSIREKKRQ